MQEEGRRLEMEALRERAQCRNCLRTWPRNSLDWSKTKEVQIGTDNSWGNWKVYTNFLQCQHCNEWAVGDESTSYKN